MKAAVLEALNKMVVKEVPEPEIGPDEALMRVEATSICGSDVRIFHHGNPRVKCPTIIGHETAGTVVKVGKNVKRVKEGDHVALGADVPCGECYWCRNGLGNNCAINYAMGYQFAGAFAQYVKMPQLLLEEGPVRQFDPRHLAFEEAALAEPLACAINGFEMTNLSVGKSVVIIGLGPIGCMMLDLARIMGATKVIGVQRSRKRMEIARTYGADHYLFSDEEDIVARCRQLTAGEGPDVVITCNGNLQTHKQAIDMVAHRGYVNLFGGLAKDEQPLNILSNTIHYKECFVTGSHGCVPRHHEIAVDLLAAGRVRVKPLITHRFPLDRINEAFDVMESRAGMKIVINPN
jgi:L-iditol 2-dehydrogenase